MNGGVSRYDGQKFEKASFDSLKITGDVTNISQIKDKIWFTSYNEGAVQVDFPVKDIKHLRTRQFTGKDGLSDRVSGEE